MLQKLASLRYIKITHRVLFSEIQRAPDTVHPMTLKILSTHAFDTGIARIIIAHKFQQNWNKLVVELNGIPYPRHQAHSANQFGENSFHQGTVIHISNTSSRDGDIFAAPRPKGLELRYGELSK